MRLNSTIPILRMFDIAKTREFYLDYLSFEVDFEHRFHEYAPLFMGISRDDVVLFLSEHHGDGSPGIHVRINRRRTRISERAQEQAIPLYESGDSNKNEVRAH